MWATYENRRCLFGMGRDGEMKSIAEYEVFLDSIIDFSKGFLDGIEMTIQDETLILRDIKYDLIVSTKRKGEGADFNLAWISQVGGTDFLSYINMD